jgi:hypothetical protein
MKFDVAAAAKTVFGWKLFAFIADHCLDFCKPFHNKPIPFHREGFALNKPLFSDFFRTIPDQKNNLKIFIATMPLDFTISFGAQFLKFDPHSPLEPSTRVRE